MEAGDHRQTAMVLREFKAKDGEPNFPMLFNIPSSERIMALAEKDFTRINMLLVGALTVAFEGMNLKRGMNAMQILTLAETIIESAGEDNISMEDFMIFLHRVISGKYELSYESMDVPKFMILFDKYRNKRWEEGIKLRDSKDEEYKRMGDDNWFDRNHIKPEGAFGQYLQSYSTRLQAKNDEIKALRSERKRNGNP